VSRLHVDELGSPGELRVDLFACQDVDGDDVVTAPEEGVEPALAAARREEV